MINQYLLKMSFDPLTTLAPIAKAADIAVGAVFKSRKCRRVRSATSSRRRAQIPASTATAFKSRHMMNHLLMERLKQTTGADITAIPFRGSPEATLALLKNEIQLFPIGLSVGAPHLREGKLTAPAVATEKRLPMLPDVPTIAEAGFAGFTASNWWGIAAPASTPGEILDTLASAVAEAQKSPLVVERFATMGLLVPQLDRAAFTATLKPEANLWQETIQRGNITVQ